MNCKFDDENNVDIQAIRNHLDQQYIGPFHAETTWKVILATLGAEAALFLLWKAWRYRQNRLKKRAGQLPQAGQHPQAGWPIPPPPSFPPPPPPMYDYAIPQRAAWATPGYARTMALGWEDHQGPPVNKNKKKGRKPDAQSRLETLKGGQEQIEEEEEDGE